MSQHRLAAWQLLGLVALGCWLLVRLALFLQIDNLSPGQALGAFGLGLLFDLATLAVLLAPLMLLGAVLPQRFLQSRLFHALRWAGLWFAIALLIFSGVSELVFWEEFGTRFNFIAVDYLIYTTEVVQNIRESYPLFWILGGLLLATTALVWFLRTRVGLTEAQGSARQRLAQAMAAVLLPSVSLGLLSVDAMEFSENTFANELSGNGPYCFTAAFRRNELDYDRFYATIPQERADAILKQLGVHRQPLLETGTHERKAQAPTLGPFRKAPRHVVLVSVESLSAKYVGVYGSADGLTPEFDRLAGGGLLFENCYASGTRTVRGLEALSLGTPPVPGQAIVRRPHNEHLASIGELLEHQGFQPLFVYGGYGYFDNMNAYFAGNDYRVIDRTDIPDSRIVFENVWGVADEVLYDAAIEAIDSEVSAGKAVFAHVMTTSNHRPYTYPDGRIDIPSPGGRKGAVRYTDYSLGRLIEQARQRPWFAETLFVIVADHCASAAGKTKLPPAGYHIPLLFYAPELLPAGRETRLMSQIDVPPTLVGLLGKYGENEFFGQNLFGADPVIERAFLSNYQELGYLRDGILTVLSPKQRIAAFRIDPKTREATPTAVVPELAEQAIAYYMTASRSFRSGKLLSPDYLSKK